MSFERVNQIKELVDIQFVRHETAQKTRFYLTTDTSHYWEDDDVDRYDEENEPEKTRPNHLAALLMFKKSRKLVTRIPAENPAAVACAVCYEEEDEHRVFGSVDGCEHRFCLECLLKWSKTNNHCPCCRQEFTRVFKSKNGMKWPVRVVFYQKEFRQLVNLTYPHLRTHELLNYPCYYCGGTHTHYNMCFECVNRLKTVLVFDSINCDERNVTRIFLSLKPNKHARRSLFSSVAAVVMKPSHVVDCKLCGVNHENAKVWGKLDSCAHEFCLECLLTWSLHKSTCAVCHKEYVRISKKTGILNPQEPVRVVLQMEYFRQVVWETFPGVPTDRIDLVYRTGDFVVFD